MVIVEDTDTIPLISGVIVLTFNQENFALNGSLLFN